MKWKSPPACELCQSKLVGTAEIDSRVEGESVVLTVKESLLVDWSCCPVCKAIVCKENCLDRRSGYCLGCAREAENKTYNFIESSSITPNNGDDDSILSADIIF